MKKLLAIALVVITAMSASAKGWYVGGAVGFWHDSKEQTNQLTLLPDFGYSFNDTWTLGTILGYQYTHFCGEKTDGNLFLINPFLRNTFWTSDNGFVSVFCDLKAGLGLGWTHYSGFDRDTDTACTWEVGLAPGLALNFTKHFSFVTHVAFLGYKGANNAAKNAGYKSEGGLLLNSEVIDFGVYYNF